ncbi:MAG: thioredoxin-disulfide reductase [Patescibacteria group bacterium]|jgi:thioredoxin reductase (NADPH)
MHTKLAIIGSGPAGLTAAIYAARAELKPIVFAGAVPGGQLTETTEVENFPGFDDGIMGPDLMAKMRLQAEKFGSVTVDASVDKVNLKKQPFTIESGDKSYSADAIIVATGASAMWLNVKGETEFKGKGVSACATCDGFFFKNKAVVIVGGGDAAMEESMFLTKFASSVTIVHRRNEFRASKIMQEKVLNNPKIKVVWDSAVVEIKGGAKVEAVVVENIKDQSKSEIKTDGVFVAIGHKPNTDIFKDQLEIDEKGYIVLHGETKSNVEGVFVAGDVYDHRYRQAITAAGSGCKAAIDAEKYLAE